MVKLYSVKLISILTVMLMVGGAVISQIPTEQAVAAGGGINPQQCVEGSTKPVAAFDLQGDTHVVGQSAEILFDAGFSLSCGSPIVAYEWDFGDGTVAEGQTVEHTYSVGSWQPSLTVTNELGESSFYNYDSNVVVRNYNQAPTVSDATIERQLDYYNTTGLISVSDYVVDNDGDDYRLDSFAVESMSNDLYGDPTIYRDYYDSNSFKVQLSTAHVTQDTVVVVKYTVKDIFGAESEGRVVINAIADNQAPVVEGDVTVNVLEDERLGWQSLRLLTTISDPEQDVLTYSVASATEHGTVELVGSSFSYEPNADFNGLDTFTYKVSDGGKSTIGTVYIVVTPVNDAPVYTNTANFVTDEDTKLTGSLASYVQDIDGDELHFSSTASWVNMSSDGSFTLTPYANYSGEYRLLFSVSDGTTNIVRAANVIINPINDAPEVSLTANVSKQGELLASAIVSDPDSTNFTYVWDFGDGDTYTTSEPSVSHLYKIKGNKKGLSFIVTVTVTDDQGASTTASIPVTL